MTKHLPLVAALLALAVAGPAAQESGLLRTWFAAYEKGDVDVISRSLTRSNARGVENDLKGLLAEWDGRRTPVQTVFLLDLALADLGPGDGLTVLEQARRFVAARPDPPGKNPSEDTLEIDWLKTVLPLLEQERRPRLLQERGIDPLKKRMAAAAGGTPKLIDPWFALTCGIAEEQWMLYDPLDAKKHGAEAIEQFTQAAASEATRAEALVRMASVQVQLGRHEDALKTLDGFGERTTDSTLVYWSRLFRGRALERLGRADDAAGAYRGAFAVLPRTQSPAVALATLETRRGRLDEAERWALAGRTAATAADPWWQYGQGEFRFFQARLDALRARVRQ